MNDSMRHIHGGHFGFPAQKQPQQVKEDSQNDDEQEEVIIPEFLLEA